MTSDILLIHLLLWYYYMCIIIHEGMSTYDRKSICEPSAGRRLVGTKGVSENLFKLRRSIWLF